MAGEVGALDDDRPLTVSSVTVNEGSPYAVFTVTGASGQLLTLTATSGTATLGTDTGVGLEYFDGTAWQAYVPGSTVTIPAGGTTLLVRIAVTNDGLDEGAERFTLTASNSAGGTATGIGTIVDDGSGSVFLPGNETGTPDSPTGPLDDDRTLAVSSVAVSESSGFAVFTVSGAAGQLVTLTAAGGSATLGTDTGAGLEYFDGTTWQTYTPGSLVALGAGGTLQVRVAIVADGLTEGVTKAGRLFTDVAGDERSRHVDQQCAHARRVAAHGHNRAVHPRRGIDPGASNTRWRPAARALHFLPAGME